MQEKSKAKQIMTQCLLVNDFLKTIKKSILTDGQNIKSFEDHYSDLIDMALSANWQIHEAAELISHDEFRQSAYVGEASPT